MNKFLKILLISCLTISCQGNFLKDAASIDEDQYLLLQAKEAINDEEYDLALQILEEQVSPAARVQAEYVEVSAIASAGKCGLNFAHFVNDLSTATSGTAFGLMMSPFVGDAVVPTSCLAALNKMESLGGTEVRSANQNAFVAIVGMALMGTQLKTSADQSPTDGDGTVDQSICAITDAEMNRFVVGFGFMTKNFGALSLDQLGSSSHGALDEIMDQCTSVAGDSCLITKESDVTGTIRDFMRDLLNTQEFGVGPVVTNGDPLLIIGACP